MSLPQDEAAFGHQCFVLSPALYDGGGGEGGPQGGQGRAAKQKGGEGRAGSGAQTGLKIKRFFLLQVFLV